MQVINKPLQLIFFFSLFISSIAFIGCQRNPDPEERENKPEEAEKSFSSVTPDFAYAKLTPTEGNSVRGYVSFIRQNDGGVRVKGTFFELTPGKHGFHVHEKGDCSAADGSSAGGHFNPGDTKHGLPPEQDHHVGDMGNIVADENGKAMIDTVFNHLELRGENSILQKGVIVHAKPDDGGQPTGNAGARVACGVIEAALDTVEVEMKSAEGEDISGTVRLHDVAGGLKVLVDLKGASPGKHGFHVHQWGWCEGEEFIKAGDHFDPTDQPHGMPEDDRHHLGDLGNIEADENGVIQMENTYENISLKGDYGIMGRSLVLHSREDDGTDPAGNSGAKIACGEI